MATASATIRANVVPVTREGYRLLREQLTTLTTTARSDASKRVRDARADGVNPAENPELLYAIQAQEQLERRIVELESQLARPQVIEQAGADGEVVLGTRVRLRRRGSRQRPLEYQIVSSVESDPTSGKLSIESPVGEALLGRRLGDTVEVAAPGGVIMFELISVEDGPGTEGVSGSDPNEALAA